MADNPVPALVIGFVVGVILFFQGFKKLKLKRLIENIPTSKVRSVAVGLVEVAGKVAKRKKVLTSPLSKKKCVYYKMHVEKLVRSGKHSHWRTVIKEETGEKFFVKDNTGSLLVDPAGAHLDIPEDFSFTSRGLLGKKYPKKVLDFGESHKLKMTGFLKQTYRFREYYLEPNDKIYVLGYAGKNPNKSFSKIGHENLMIQKSKFAEVFYISDKHEEGVLKGLNKKAMWMIYGGPVLTVICLALLILYFTV